MHILILFQYCFITGDLSRRYKKCGLPLRQDGFQSTDIISIVQPITKYAEMLQSPSDICFCLKRAIFEATTGRRGPVFLSIPHWIQCAEIDPSTLKDFTPEYENFFSLSSMLLKKDILGTLQRCHRPLLLVGGGCCDQETKNMLIKFLERNPIPVVASLCGLNALPHDHPSYVGFIGDYGHRHANLALSASDCLIVLGARMDDRQIGALKESHTNKTIIHVDIDPSELQTYSEYYLPINDSIANFLNILNTESFNMITGWNNEISHLKSKYPIITLQNSFTAPVFLRRLSEFLLPNAQVFVDVGLHQMCSAQALELSKQKTMFVSGGLGSMGYALPACIGGYFASPERQTICISGDGGLLMSLNELQTIARERLNVKIIVLNNHCLGMILDYQRKNFNGRAFGSVEGYQPCNLEKTAGAFDLFFHKFSNLDDICNLFEVLDHHGPTLIGGGFAARHATIS